jgi:hypothetical protein
MNDEPGAVSHPVLGRLFISTPASRMQHASGISFSPDTQNLILHDVRFSPGH